MEIIKNLTNPTRRKGTGLVYKPHEDEDYDLKQFGGFFDAKLPEVPDKPFTIVNPTIHNQGSVPNCVGYGVATILSYHEKVEMSGIDSWIIAKELDGNNNWGTSLKQGCVGSVKVGACEYLYNPDNNFNASKNLNMSHLSFDKVKALKENREEHKQKSYFKVNHYSDNWSNLLSAMFKYHEPILTGLDWYGSYNSIKSNGLLPIPSGGAFGHCTAAVNLLEKQGELMLDLVTHFGQNFADRGHFYLTKDQVNRFLYPSYIILDIEQDIAKVLQKYTNKCVKVKDNKNCYIIKDGKKYLLKNEHYASSFGILLFESVIEIEQDELDIIPSGDKLKIEDGSYWMLLRQSLLKEKIKIENIL